MIDVGKFIINFWKIIKLVIRKPQILILQRIQQSAMYELSYWLETYTRSALKKRKRDKNKKKGKEVDEKFQVEEVGHEQQERRSKLIFYHTVKILLTLEEPSVYSVVSSIKSFSTSVLSRHIFPETFLHLAWDP